MQPKLYPQQTKLRDKWKETQPMQQQNALPHATYVRVYTHDVKKENNMARDPRQAKCLWITQKKKQKNTINLASSTHACFSSFTHQIKNNKTREERKINFPYLMVSLLRVSSFSQPLLSLSMFLQLSFSPSQNPNFF